MGDLLIQLANQFRELLADMSASRKAAILIFVGLVVSSLVALMVWARQPDFQVLYTGLSQTDAGAIVNRLREQNVAFRVEGTGTIMVPAGRVHDVRLAMAEESLPAGGGMGFEIFDQSALGVTDFVQKVNFLRALQGELARTISQLRAVQSARIHIVMPERALFVEERRKASASVVLSLVGGTSLPKGQVRGIVHLVASAVEGLESKGVTVVDSRGNILSGGRGEEDADFLSASQMEMKASVERRLEDRVESMLGRVLGPGRAVARVNVEMNMRRIERTRELYDPEKQVVRSERRTKEQSESAQGNGGGVPGVQSNVPESERTGTARTGGTQTGQKSSRVSETVNFEIDKTVERIVEPIGDIRRISVAVMVDGTYAPGAEGGAETFKPRSQGEIENFTSLVSAAVGLDTKRGDSVKILSAPFRAGLPDAGPEPFLGAQQGFILQLVKYVLAVVALALIFIFVVRPLLNWISTLSVELRPAAIPGREGMALDALGRPLPEGLPAAALRAAEPPPAPTPQQLELEEARRIYDEVYEYVSSDPSKAAEIVRSWMRERT